MMASKHENISVVIPLYNKARHIERAVNSVLRQTCDEFELIVVNDGSTDGSEQIVRRISDPRIRLIEQENAGVSGARNRGIAESHGDLIAFLDADDEWLPEHLATIKMLAGKYPQCGAYATAYQMVDKDGTMRSPRYYGIPDAPWEGMVPNYFRSRMGSYFMHISSTAVKREVFQEVGNFATERSWSEDDDMLIRIALKYRIAFSRKTCLIYYRNADNRVSDDGTYPFKMVLLDTLKTPDISQAAKVGISESDIRELRNRFILKRINRYLAEGKLDAREAEFWLREAQSTRLFQRKWRIAKRLVKHPWFLPLYRTKSKLRELFR